MTWPTARARIKTVLEGVSITNPIAQSIVKVWEFPPETVQDYPSCVLLRSSLVVDRRVSLRHKVYEVELELLVIEEQQVRAIELVEAYREAILDAFDADLTLNGNASVIDGPQFGFPEGDGAATRMTFTLTVRLTEAATFGP